MSASPKDIMDKLHSTLSGYPPPIAARDIAAAIDMLGPDATHKQIEQMVRRLYEDRSHIKIVKQPERGIVPDRRLQLLRRIEIAQSEVGRLNKLLDEIRADVLHLTTD